MNSISCPACLGHDVELFLDIPRSPVFCSLLCPTRQQALDMPRASIRLGFCRDCGLISNVAFDEKLLEYSGSYENSLHFSPCFQHYAQESAQRLIDRYHLHGKDIIEIGCGQGDFLSLLCKLGSNRGVGFDPSYRHPSGPATDPSVTILPEAYCQAHASRPADLICCRHVLEHIARPLDFLRSIRRAIGDRTNTILFFEVPSASYMLRELAIWDVIYEHCLYFTPSAIRYMFATAGFDTLETRETYGGQFLTIDARPRAADQPIPSTEPPDPQTLSQIHQFAREHDKCIASWHSKLDLAHQQGLRMAIWGAGSKGVTFLNRLDVSHDRMPYAVDVNPRKHGHFVCGTGQQIVPPDSLPNLCPSVLILLNSLYRAEVVGLTRQLGLSSEVWTAQ